LLAENKTVDITPQISVTPITVPHRGEYSETVAFKIVGPNRSILFLPDIDKWSRWEKPIEEILAKVDVAFLDATFFADGEIPGRNMSEIPHPFVQESIERFQPLNAETRAKIHFIHLNHTNPALDPTGDAAKQIQRAGMNLAEQGKCYGL
jgi:pyrroloquinoline quinone biosynthesis protein B